MQKYNIPGDMPIGKDESVALSEMLFEHGKKNVAKKSSENKKSKWFGKTIEEIEAIWKKESDRACDLGNWYHAQRENDIVNCNTIVRYDKELAVIREMSALPMPTSEPTSGTPGSLALHRT
jgi:hypothetical protein